MSLKRDHEKELANGSADSQDMAFEAFQDCLGRIILFEFALERRSRPLL